MIERMMIAHWTMREWSCPPEADDATSVEDEITSRTEGDSVVSTEEQSDINDETSPETDDRWRNDRREEAELLIPILFYYDSRNTPEHDEVSHRRSMLQFAGAAHALYHLPQTILPLVLPSVDAADHHDEENISSRSSDRTNVVQFDDGTAWVFVPLGSPWMTNVSPPEEEHRRTVDLVAVVQIQTFPSSEAATPTAVAHSLQRAYALFSLLRHGSIHERLLRPPRRGTNVLPQNHFDAAFYPGMDQLYKWYRRNHRPRSADPSFLSSLPYTALRRDLDYHFHDWIMNCHPCRNLIECIPPPISNATDSVSTNGIVFPAAIDPNIVHILKSAANELCQMNDGPPSQLIGMSFFINNQPVVLKRSNGNAANNHVINTVDGTALPNETAILLHQYMTQVQYRMTQPSSGTANHPPEKKKGGISLRLPSFARSFLKDDTMRIPVNRTQLPTFLPPPPLSILNVGEDTESSAFVCADETVWAPPVALTIVDESESSVDARICFFSHEKLHALIYLSRAMDEEPKEMYQSLLTDVANVLNRALECLLETKCGLSPKEKSIDDPENELSILQRSWDTLDGFDMIAVDRYLNTSTIYIDEVDPKVISTLSHVPFPLDDRYVLLYHLSSDTLLALEDAIDEVLRYTKSIRDNEVASKASSCFERCTLLRKHWVYCHAEEDKELYLLFHTSHFVTMADVQRVAKQLRKEFWDHSE